MTKRKVLARGVEYYPDTDTLLLLRCPKCEQENYAPNAVTGVCTWCGYDARILLKKKLNNNK